MATIDVIHRFATEQRVSVTQRQHMLAPLKVARKLGYADAAAALANIDDVVGQIAKDYDNPRTKRNYMQGLRMLVRVPEVQRALGQQRSVDVDRRLNAELSDLNHAAYQLTRRSEVESSQLLIERLKKENGRRHPKHGKF